MKATYCRLAILLRIPLVKAKRYCMDVILYFTGEGTCYCLAIILCIPPVKANRCCIIVIAYTYG